jgi:hypothetical protein
LRITTMTTEPKCHRCGKPCGHAYADYGDETLCLDCDAALADLSWRYDGAGPLDDVHDDGEGVDLGSLASGRDDDVPF